MHTAEQGDQPSYWTFLQRWLTLTFFHLGVRGPRPKRISSDSEDGVRCGGGGEFSNRKGKAKGSCCGDMVLDKYVTQFKRESWVFKEVFLLSEI